MIDDLCGPDAAEIVECLGDGDLGLGAALGKERDGRQVGGFHLMDGVERTFVGHVLRAVLQRRWRAAAAGPPNESPGDERQAK